MLDGTPAGAVGGNSPGSITTSAANSLLIVGLVGFHSATNWTAPSGWSITQAATHDAVGIAFHVQATPGTVAPTFTGTSIDSNAQVIVGFRAGTSSAFAGGSNDDYYFQTNTHALYGPKIGGAWPTSPIPFASFVAAVPATSSSSGTPGSMAYDSSGNLYWCYATNAWARVGPAGYSSSF